jgi:hypothetical protein
VIPGEEEELRRGSNRGKDGGGTVIFVKLDVDARRGG